MAFVNPSSKIERAVMAFLILQSRADPTATFISNDVRVRSFPNRTILATGFNPSVPHRQDGVVYFGIQHHFSGAQDSSNPDVGALRKAMDDFVSATVDTMTISDGNSLSTVADGITRAGRWLAQTDGTDDGDAIAANNADMVDFRCDWIKMETPFLVRGKADEKGDYWVEILNFSAFVSQASN
jgi:hypothetical protein